MEEWINYGIDGEVEFPIMWIGVEAITYDVKFLLIPQSRGVNGSLVAHEHSSERVNSPGVNCTRRILQGVPAH